MAIKNLRPPHYAADKPGHYIARTDDALDTERYHAELEAMGAELAKRLEADPDLDVKATGLLVTDHPLNRYWSGAHRFDLDAVDYFMGAPVKIRDYFNKGEPQVVVFRRLSPEEYQQCMSLRRRGDYELSSLRACRLGVIEVIGAPPIKLRRVDGELDDASMQALHDADPDLPLWLGTANLLGYSGGLRDIERFR